MSKKVTVRIVNTNVISPSAVMLNESFIKQWRIPNTTILHFGSFKHTVNVVPVTRLDGIRISHMLANKTGLSSGDVVSMQYLAQSQTLKLGPLIGVLLRQISGSASGSLFGKTAAFSKELSAASRLYGACTIFFTPKDLKLDQASVNAWVYRKGWRKRNFPLPDVVYNRLTTRKVENSPIVQRFFKETKQKYNGKVFNERYLDKTEVFHLLKNEPGLRKFLPESHPFTNFSMLQTMCQRHPIVFLKPIRGSLGKGILRIIREPGGFKCQHATISGIRTQRFSTLRRCYSSIIGKLKSQKYQIQQGIKLIHSHGRPLDFRALVQRNQNGDWHLTSIVARTAGAQHFVSNVARGGTLSQVKPALQKSNLPATKRESVFASMREAAVHIAEGLQRQTPDHFAELGIDFAVSGDGKVWLLEVNSKPSKDDNTPVAQQKIRPSVKQTVQYAKHLFEL